MVDKSATIDSIVKQLKSGLIKERQEGLTQLRTSFNNARVVQNLDDKGNGIVWLVIFQALFDAFDKEKLACTKKGSLVTAATGPGALALRRLAEIASGVRLLTEQSVQRLNGKVVRPLLAHLLSNLKYQGQLLEAVSFNYIKAIRCILSWAPHLDHLDDQTWLRLVELSFNVILGDPFKTRLEDEEEQDVKEESVAPELSAPEEDAMDVDESASPTKKRRHAESVRPTNRVLITSTKSQDSGPVSQEKVELAYLLSVLLSTPSSPLLSKDYPFLPAAILNRLQRFLVLYPGDSSLTHDYLVALSAVLSRLTLNRRQLVIDFAREAWSGLVRLWGTKNQQLKEDLVAILRMLFPFYTVEEDHDSEYADGIAALWKLLDGEAESRWGINGLSLQSLILQVASDEAALPLSPFVAKTFQHGWQFKADQALAWAILELRADCIEKLFRLSESVHGVAKRGDGKRVKLVNPVTTLLDSVMKKNDPTAKVYHLQALLFTIDRHWSSLHHSLQQDVVSTLSQFLSYDEPSIQSWTFMCFASIANASKEGPTSSVSSRIPSSSNDSSSWDSIWTHAMRRSNVPAVCRAACHVAHVLLLNAKSLLSPRRVIAEIETLAKDLDVQGPSFPYDSVCSFLILCMRVASQDVRLYRMQVEEKVLAWLLDAWRPGSTNRSKMPLHSVQDILGLLGAICASGKRVDLLCEMLLPASSIVSAMVEEHSTAVIRQFLLYARLPPFAKPAQARHAALPDAEPTSTAYTPTSGFDLRDLSEPGGRERRISAFFQKKLEDCAQSWEVPQDSRGKPTAERARLFLDFSIMALAFEATLLLNGTRSNRRVIQAACKLLDLIAPTMADPRWTPDERALIVSALDPLILAEPRIGETVPWEAMLPPGEGTGIRKELLRSLTAGSDAPSRCTSALRRDLQRILLQNADVSI
ncbi:hypothetical protein EW026_g2611 [Hermanssonia centrifuga]|uniref:Telomere-length maintenance and DNA damage repair domain-containing protein n=1 Tax=Hermanssonia centrifuga TaxID=98765 RepID=A0A4V3XAX5_9APHY|nr:hypothetical protein EW026_g2611 [Hermanssonia centrifuga]